ncbi:hypothetical protein GCM10027275_50480 [Rhabdobacter roseus]|uniref:Uncharacterized protein n=1 Tax=Rhabdobacter roseus TaxID=1655419 RepID=A0A840TT41_9BACT|nr:hypothetical protein [Rhabdobacter roseus]MBB5287121.1 hypothetical protein [Rhabdobacter roseus]
MLGQLHTLAPTSRPNPGFLTHVYLIPADGVAYVLPPTAGLVLPERGVGIVPGALITQLKPRALTATLTEGQQQGADGPSYLVEITVPFASDYLPLAAWVQQHARRRFVVVLRDTLGNAYLVGTRENGARLAWGRQIQSRHAQSLVLRAVSLHPMATLASVDPEVLFPNRDWDYSFDLSF